LTFFKGGSQRVTANPRIMDGGKKVWVPHPVEGFKMGRIVDIGGDTISVELFETPGQVMCMLTMAVDTALNFVL
jgi:hypothetical protein